MEKGKRDNQREREEIRITEKKNLRDKTLGKGDEIKGVTMKRSEGRQDTKGEEKGEIKR